MAADRAHAAHQSERYCLFWDADNCAYTVASLAAIQKALAPAYLVSTDVFASGPMAQQLVTPAANDMRPAGGVLHVDISSGNNVKSLTDQRLTITALEKADSLLDAARVPTKFVIISNDKDFIPLYTQLRRKGIAPVAAGYACVTSPEVQAVVAQSVQLPARQGRQSGGLAMASWFANQPHVRSTQLPSPDADRSIARPDMPSGGNGSDSDQCAVPHIAGSLDRGQIHSAGASTTYSGLSAVPSSSTRNLTWPARNTCLDNDSTLASSDSVPPDSVSDSDASASGQLPCSDWRKLLNEYYTRVTAAQGSRAAAVQHDSKEARRQLAARLQECSAQSLNGLWHAVKADLPMFAYMRGNETFKAFVLAGIERWDSYTLQMFVALLISGPHQPESCPHWVDDAFPGQIGRRLTGQYFASGEHTYSTQVMRNAANNARYVNLGTIFLLAVQIALSKDD